MHTKVKLNVYDYLISWHAWPAKNKLKFLKKVC